MSLVGSTGSIGTQTIDVVRAEPDRYRVIALAASTSVDELAAQAEELRPDVVAIADASLAPKLRELDPWSLGSALALALVASVVGPIGDLCESMIKRDLNLKDMSSVVPGHGGVLDRFDAILFVLPAVWYMARLSDFFLT